MKAPGNGGPRVVTFLVTKKTMMPQAAKHKEGERVEMGDNKRVNDSGAKSKQMLFGSHIFFFYSCGASGYLALYCMLVIAQREPSQPHLRYGQESWLGTRTDSKDPRWLRTVDGTHQQTS